MIVFFSGTGNSKHVAKVLATALDDCLADASEYLREVALPVGKSDN